MPFILLLGILFKEFCSEITITSGTPGYISYVSKVNVTGFNGKPSGYQGTNGSFGAGEGLWCSATTKDVDLYYVKIRWNEYNLLRTSGAKNYGFSCRCIKD